MWCASPGVRPRSASSSTNPDSDGVARCSRRRARPATDGGSRSPYRCDGVGVGDDHVGRQPLAVGQPHARRPAALDQHLRDGGPERARRRRAAAPARARPRRAGAARRGRTRRRTSARRTARPTARPARGAGRSRCRSRSGRATSAAAGRAGTARRARAASATARPCAGRRSAGPAAAGPGRRPAATPGTAPRVTCQMSCARSRNRSQSAPAPAPSASSSATRSRAREAFGTSSQVTSWPSTPGTGSAPPGRPARRSRLSSSGCPVLTNRSR